MAPKDPLFRDLDERQRAMDSDSASRSIKYGALPPLRMQPIPLKTVGSIYRDEETNELFWNNPGLLIEESDKIGSLEDIDDALDNVKVILTKKALKGEL